MHVKQTGFSFIILNRHETQVLGTVNFSNVSRYPLYACYLGYALAEDSQKRGYYANYITGINTMDVSESEYA